MDVVDTDDQRLDRIVYKSQWVIFVIGTIIVGWLAFTHRPGRGPDLYQVDVGREGLENMDPKLESLQTISTCTIEGRPAKFGVVEISVNYLALGGTNSRHSMGKTYVMARELANGNLENYIASADQQDQVSQLKEKWTQFWGCKLQ